MTATQAATLTLATDLLGPLVIPAGAARVSVVHGYSTIFINSV